ncbi:helix-turn-helix domain-containing protein [Kocuria atrinae]|uniref:helix-turn-helix domain-containing protein n=1 Tax=Kocuria atrinae TaxID=592377 RepID=UPI001CB955FB
MALRRRVVLEQAAWQLQRGKTVTDAAFGAGYDSVEGFSRAFHRAFGHPPRGCHRNLSGGIGCRRPTEFTSTHPRRCMSTQVRRMSSPPVMWSDYSFGTIWTTSMHSW